MRHVRWSLPPDEGRCRHHDAALHADKLQPLFMNGMAQPIFPYTTGSVESGYSNEDSAIIRYVVYVETNYDTDDDGKLDLVKAVVQIPVQPWRATIRRLPSMRRALISPAATAP